MAGNSIGKAFIVTSFGESHGRCVGVVVDGCPPGISLSEKDIQPELDRRRPHGGPYGTARIEEDEAQILSGVFNGFTTGAPICMLIWNKDVDSTPYDEIRYKPRPGHADYTAFLRYHDHHDHRGGGRFSARTTAGWVMAGALAKKILTSLNIEVLAHTVKIGGVRLTTQPSVETIRRMRYSNPVRCVDADVATAMEKAILTAKADEDSLGGMVECIVPSLPGGMGDPLFDALDADLSKALFSIPAVKGVEFGAGFNVTRLRGSENNDEYAIRDGRIVTLTNNAGGILGGLTTGMPLILRVAFKPVSSITRPQRTVNLQTLKETMIELKGRYDPCTVPRAVPIVEAMTAIVIVDHALRVGFIKSGRRTS